MTCKHCDHKKIFTDPNLCKSHFLDYFEQKVIQTIENYSLIEPNQDVAVAVSGGKDSLTVLYILKKLGHDVTGIAIDEGIENYRNKTLEDLKKFCDKFDIPLKIASFSEDFSFTMDHVATSNSKKTPCNTCGVLRRYALHTASKKYDILATGHNRDDESQVIFMNLINGTFPLSARLGPKTGINSHKSFTQRIKPLYFCSEKEVMTYAFLKGFAGSYSECPYASKSLRFKVRDLLNDIELTHPGVKQQLIEGFIELLPNIKETYGSSKSPKQCKRCSEPSGNDICNACKVREEFACLSP